MNEDAVITRALNADPLVKRCWQYLSSLGVVLWGDFDISIPMRRLDAAKWLARQVEGVDRLS